MDKNLLATKVAKAYYEDGHSQAEIARMLQLGHASTVSRLLKYARKEGLVEIVIRSEPSPPQPVRIRQLEVDLVRSFHDLGLRNSIVVDFPYGEAWNADQDDRLHKAMGKALAEYLRGIIRSGDHIGVCGGRGVYYTARALYESDVPLTQADLTFTALAGRMSTRHYGTSSTERDRLLDADDVVFTLVTAFRKAKGRTLSIPVFVSTPEKEGKVNRTPFIEYGPGRIISKTEWEGDKDNRVVPNLAIVGIGSFMEGHRLFELYKEDFLPDSVKQDLLLPLIKHTEQSDPLQYCPVGDLAYRLFHADPPKDLNIEVAKADINKLIRNIDERILAVTSFQLRMIDRVIAVAGGPYKQHAIWTVLTSPELSGIVHELCTDRKTAESLLRRKRNQTAGAESKESGK